MSVSPMKLINHELVGLETHVVASCDPTHVNRLGTIVAETREMIQLDTDQGEILLSKEICVFEIKFEDGSIVRVDGNLLRGRPEDRLKKRTSRRW